MNAPLDPDRRRLLRASLAAAAPWCSLAFAGQAGADANRFVMVVLRGGLDGLAAVPPIGDADFVPARGALARFATPPLALDSRFALHPQLVQLHAMVGRGEALVVHAVGLPYHERSHFDAQQVLESGGVRPYEIQTGWLGRALAANGAKGVALSTAVPLVLRGPGTVDTWAPSVLPEPSADLVARLERMYDHDRALATALARAKALYFDAPAMAATAGMGDGAGRGGNFPLLTQRAAEFLAQPAGPQAAVLELGGWTPTPTRRRRTARSPTTCAPSTPASPRCATGSWPAAHGSAAWWSWPPNSGARWRSTARKAPITAAAGRRSCWAAP